MSDTGIKDEVRNIECPVFDNPAFTTDDERVGCPAGPVGIFATDG